MIRPEPAAAWALKPGGSRGVLLAGKVVDGGAAAYVREPATVIFKKGDPVGKPAVPAKARSMVTAALILRNFLLIATKSTDAPDAGSSSAYHRSFVGGYRHGSASHRLSVDVPRLSVDAHGSSGTAFPFTVHSHRSSV